MKNRSHEPELMDDFQLKGPVLHQCLRELDKINRYLGGNAVVQSGIKKVFNKYPALHEKEKIRILDIGCGSGDMLKQIARWGKHKNLNLELTGVDANHDIVEYAQEQTKDFNEISIKYQNVIRNPVEENYDIIICSLFLHHLCGKDILLLLKQFQSIVQYGIIINDLHRHILAYLSIKLLTKIFNGSELVQHDAPLSVERAFKKDELKKMVSELKGFNYAIQWKWAFRYQVILTPKV